MRETNDTSMKCEDFRLQWDGAGRASFDGAEAHLEECAACAEFAAAAPQFDARLKRALEIPVPALEFRVPDDDNVVPLAGRGDAAPAGRSRGLTWLALAASVALAAVLGFRMFDTPPAPGNNLLAQQVLEHMQHEEYSRVVTQQAVAGERLQSVIQPANAEVDRTLGLVSYAMSCVINGKLVPHLVVQGEQGPVTIMILADETVDEAITLQNDEFHGTIVPVGRGGSVAIIGRKGESIDDVRAKVGESIRLSI
ncbi:MAG: DUF3379 family protein [Pseudomonadota bacterium]